MKKQKSRIFYPVNGYLSSYLNFGYLTRDEKNRYDLSIKIFDIGRKFRQRSDIKNIARPYMQRIVHQFNETIVLGMLDNTSVLYIDKIDSFEMLRFVPQTEQRITAHHTALGKSILAHLPPDKLKQYCINAPWRPCTPKSIPSIDKLLLRLPQIRKQGFAISDEEYCMGLRAIAVPILDQKNYPKFSISIWGPVNRMVPETLRDMQQELSEACTEISKYYKTEDDELEELDYTVLAPPIANPAEKPKRVGLLERTLTLFL